MKRLLFALAFISILLAASVVAASEYDRFIMANAEIGCFSMSGRGQHGSVENEANPYQAIAQKHGFTLDELEALGEKYPGSETVVGQEMQKQCPKVMGAINRMGQSDQLKGGQGGPHGDLNKWKQK